MLKENWAHSSNKLPTFEHISHLQRFYFTFKIDVFSVNTITDWVLSTL